MNVGAVILAAGQGTRMRSSLPKVLHPLLGWPMLKYVVEAARQATGAQPVAVIGHGGEAIQQAFNGQASFAWQMPQLGTGHAVQQAEALLRGQADLVLVVNGDLPLLTAETLGQVVQAQQSFAGPLTLLTCEVDDPRGFGRIVRGPDGLVQAIVEEAQATAEQRALRELNIGVYCFAADWLWNALRQVPLSPKGEYYLTDVVGLAVSAGLPVQAVRLADSREGVGINTRVHLAEATAILRERINRNWMLAGVTLIDPATTHIEPGVTIGQDTVIWPNTILRGDCVIGENCELGPNSMVQDSRLGQRCRVTASFAEKAILEDDVRIGPYAHLRSGAHLERGVHMGNFGEVKNSHLGPGVRMGHFSYIGDAEIGADVNIGAGTITCNYDGEKKNHTEVGAGAFIGSDTMLVAPVKVGIGARTGAGAVVTRNVPDYTLAVGVPARPIRKLEKRD